MTSAPRSLRSRLTLAVVGVLGVSLFAFSLALYAAFGRALWRQFDARLADDARAIANLVEERDEGSMELEPGALDELERTHGAGYQFEIWMDDGLVLARSSSLGRGDLPRLDGRYASFDLPDGRRGRVFTTSLLPRRDEESPSRPSGRRITVAIGRASEAIDGTLATLRLLLLASGVTTLGLAALAGMLAIRGGLKPIRRLSLQVDAIHAERLGERLPVEDLPRELRPAVDKMNELLARLEGAFTRERQFSADVSHELRTPLAGLRSILEVVSSRNRTGPEYKTALRDALDVVERMQRLIENLLMLTRLGAHQVAIARKDVPLRRLVDECFSHHASRARDRGLSFENRVAGEVVVTSDEERLRIVVANLIGNAVEYTNSDGRIVVESNPASGRLLDVRDSGPAIPESALQAIFNPFFRLEPSRSGNGEHCGVGLTLVRALCGALGFSVSAENAPDGWVAFRVMGRDAEHQRGSAG